MQTCKCCGCDTHIRKSKFSQLRDGYCRDCSMKGHDLTTSYIQFQMHEYMRKNNNIKTEREKNE